MGNNILIDIGLWVAIIAVIGGALLSFSINIFEMIKQKGGLLRLIIIFIAIVIFLGACYIISPGEILPNYTNTSGQLISTVTSKIIGGALIAFYILSLGAVSTILYREFFQKLFK